MLPTCQRIIIIIAAILLALPDPAQVEDPNAQQQWRNQANELRIELARELVRDWSLTFGRDIHFGTQEATCLRSIRDQFSPGSKSGLFAGDQRPSIQSIDWTRLHAEIVKTISNQMSWHKSAVESIARASEDLAGNHTFDKSLTYEYVDVHRLQNLEDQESTYQTDLDSDQGSGGGGSSSQPDESSDGIAPIGNNNQEVGQLDANGQLVMGSQTPLLVGDDEPPEPLPTASSLVMEPFMGTIGCGNSSLTWETPIRYLKLKRHPNFGDVLINTEESAVHVPVHIYPCESQVMNGIAWSDELTKVFKDNFARNPRLTNQYFASQSGFMRLFPSQQWQINRTDPDLYDARMRPWYVAAASSRKDVVILVDSSGSMTGSRRDIAKGVVFEILDTLTDNDNFLILKFSDTIQQVGSPSCSKLRQERRNSSIPLKNTLYHQELLGERKRNENETDIDAFYMSPASGRNVRHVKTNFTIPTSGIANFSQALVAAFEVLRNYQAPESLGAQCNQAIMLVTDGSPSGFEDIFNLYNIPNAPVRVFTYLIGREATDVGHTKMMACHNRGYYTHVINLAEVRETVQQYIPVMARPLVLNGTHPITWTPAYGELTYQMLTDWIWESKRREKARAILAAQRSGGSTIRITNDDGTVYNPTNSDLDYDINNGDKSLGDSSDSMSLFQLNQLDLFGYNSLECFWQIRRNDLLTTVVQPVYDRRNESVITERFLQKNIWTERERVMRTAQILGVAAADMKINDIIALAPSHKLGPNGYAVMLTNNGFVMHHPDLRSILEPFSSDPSERNMRILKPHFSSMDLTQVEHVLDKRTQDSQFVAMRQEAVSGLTGWRELDTKRTLDCQKRVQTRRQAFYYKPIDQFPFSFLIAIPQPYGGHRLRAQVEIKGTTLRERLTNHFTASDYDLWTVHPDYRYCDGPSNNTITTLLDMFQRIEAGKLDDVQWRPAESTKPPLFMPSKIVCDKDLVQSLVFDAIATFGFADHCSPPAASSTESSLLGMFGVRFSFVATRSGLTRVRHYDADDVSVKREALAFARRHARALDETYYQRTVDYNMLVNVNATLIQVPFNSFERIRERLAALENNRIMQQQQDSSVGEPTADAGIDSILAESRQRLSVKDMSVSERLEILANSSLHVIATQSVIVNEGTQRAAAGVAGVFYDFASFALRFFNSTNQRRFFDLPRSSSPIPKPAACFGPNPSNKELCGDSNKMGQSTTTMANEIRCGHSNDTIDCLLVDNNGYIIVSEQLDFIGRHLKAYEPELVKKLVSAGVFHEINVTDYQSICMRPEEKQPSTSSASSLQASAAVEKVLSNMVASLAYTLTMAGSLAIAWLPQLSFAQSPTLTAQTRAQLQQLPPLPSKTYLRPCEKVRTLYETRGGRPVAGFAKRYTTTRCQCEAWFVYEQVPMTNLFMLVVESAAGNGCSQTNCDHLSPDTLLDPYEAAANQQEEPGGESVQTTTSSSEEVVCSNLEREASLYRKRLDSCFSHHPDEEHIKLCGSAPISTPLNLLLLITLLVLGTVSLVVEIDFLF